MRQGEFAAARARVGVEAVENDFLLHGCEFREVHAGKFGGAIGVSEEDFALVLESFDFSHDGHAEKGANFGFVDGGIPEADMLLDDAAFGVQNERSGQGGDSAELDADVIGSHGHGIIDAHFLDVLLDVGLFVVDIEADDLQAVFVAVLQSDEVGNFRSARSAPRGPEIKKDDFALQRGESEGLAVERGELEVGRGIGVANEADDRLVVLLRRSLCTCQNRWEANKQCS